MEPLTSSKIKINNIKFDKPSSTNFGNFIDILYKYSEYKTGKFYYQTPKLLCKFGVNKNYIEKTGELKDYSLSLYLYDEYESEKKIDKFKNKLQKFDIKILKYAKINSKKWLNKNNITDEELDCIYYKTLKYKLLPDSDEIDTSKPPFINVKLKKFWKLRNSDGTVIPNITEDNISKYINNNAIVKIIAVPQIWCVGDRFGVTHQVREVIIYDPGSDYIKEDKNKNNKPQFTQTKLDSSMFKIDNNTTQNYDNCSNVDDKTDTEDSDNYSD